MDGSGRFRRWLAGVTAVIATAGVVIGVGGLTSPAAAAGGDLWISGHGYGHGRGLAQWGSYGYATRYGWSYQQILAHYYGNAALGNAGNPGVTVRLMALDGRALSVTSAQAFTVDGRTLPAGSAATISRNGDGSWQLTTLTSCTGTTTGSVRIGATTFATVSAPVDDVTRMLNVCAPEFRAYRGTLTAVWDGALHTVNSLPTEDYLRGVVPRESPASWGDAAGGAGLNALRAQAVAARSYAISEARYPYAKTCDTTTCQVYGGAGLNLARIEDPRTDRAVSDTAGVVVTLNGQAARTEFSSSSGGFTAPGLFPAVPDLGDIDSPYHDWSVAVPGATIAAAYGVGTLQSVTVLSRNGYGADGGRVLTVRVTGTGGSVDPSGTDFRTKLGLRSDWFTIVPSYDPTRDDISPVGVSAVRTALNTVLVFVRGTDRRIWVTTATNGAFGPWLQVGGGALNGPAAATTDGRRVHLFVTGLDRALWHTVTTVDDRGQPTTFSPWESLGGVLTTGPAAASSASGRVVASGRGSDGTLWSRVYDGGWQPWQTSDGLGISAPALDVVDSETYRMWVVGLDGMVWSRQISAATGVPVANWANTGRLSGLAPAVSATSALSQSIRALAVTDGAAVEQYWGNGPYVAIGGVLTSAVSLIEWGTTSVWTLGRGTDNALWLNVVTGSGASSAWYRVGGVLM